MAQVPEEAPRRSAEKSSYTFLICEVSNHFLFPVFNVIVDYSSCLTIKFLFFLWSERCLEDFTGEWCAVYGQEPPRLLFAFLAVFNEQHLHRKPLPPLASLPQQILPPCMWWNY